MPFPVCLLTLLTITPFRHSHRRSSLLLTRQERIKVLHRLPPLPQGAQKIITQALSFKGARTGVERAAVTNNRPYTPRIRCRIPTRYMLLRTLMWYHSYSHGRRDHLRTH